MIKFIAGSIAAVSLFLTASFIFFAKWKRQKKVKKIKVLMERVFDLLEKGGAGNTAAIEKEKKTTRHHLEMAKWLLDQVRSLESGHALAMHYTGMYYLALGNLIEAETLCKKAERVAPDDPIICNGLGLVFEQKGDRHRAKTYFEKSLHRRSDNPIFRKGETPADDNLS